MGFKLTSVDYVDILIKIAHKIDENKDYITELDSITGDGDHWANMNMGFRKIIEQEEVFKQMGLSDLFKNIGMTLMKSIGGSSGVLYGSAYIACSKKLIDAEVIDENVLLDIYETSLNAIMERGKAKPGFKTMIDTLYPAVNAYKAALEENKPFKEALEILTQAAEEGMKSTKDMKAVKGRATYQANKGVGHLDPGAVTMYYQIDMLTEYILSNIIS